MSSSLISQSIATWQPVLANDELLEKRLENTDELVCDD